jgi:hypothetical protein
MRGCGQTSSLKLRKHCHVRYLCSMILGFSDGLEVLQRHVCAAPATAQLSSAVVCRLFVVRALSKTTVGMLRML